MQPGQRYPDCQSLVRAEGTLSGSPVQTGPLQAQAEMSPVSWLVAVRPDKAPPGRASGGDFTDSISKSVKSSLEKVQMCVKTTQQSPAGTHI